MSCPPRTQLPAKAGTRTHGGLHGGVPGEGGGTWYPPSLGTPTHGGCSGHGREATSSGKRIPLPGRSISMATPRGHQHPAWTRSTHWHPQSPPTPLGAPFRAGLSRSKVTPSSDEMPADPRRDTGVGAVVGPEAPYPPSAGTSCTQRALPWPRPPSAPPVLAGRCGWAATRG